ncbi:molecular chaperone GrpE [Mycoplasmoides fastidiosum]|uniref:Protein GrpE n=1 Tax=Mycoplasmoides fastidiosum TaxID=92758 RepID=A0ABU0LXY1_9BACT|nr:nucleotide exchange factor GrpE [Mycoplasmoides fastidiosum]MDQ0513571.1 molecular chaperone GrpE [Mycoplasmoides fastidiosum]UUD38006.1 nucleotide exchange factor GrpE [Mycoplasmoides fastidiosum]
MNELNPKRKAKHNNKTFYTKASASKLNQENRALKAEITRLKAELANTGSNFGSQAQQPKTQGTGNGSVNPLPNPDFKKILNDHRNKIQELEQINRELTKKLHHLQPSQKNPIPTPTNSKKTHGDLVAELERLKHRIDETEKRHKKELEAHEIEVRRKLQGETNDAFLAKVQEKAEQAEKVLNQKIIAYQQKFEAELNHAKKYALEKQAIELVTIIGQFESVLSMNPTDPVLKNYVSGFMMFLNMFNQLLENLNIRKIPVQLGDEYNSEIMEAFETVPAQPGQENKVVVIVAPGYQLHERIIKPTLVKVGAAQN